MLRLWNIHLFCSVALACLILPVFPLAKEYHKDTIVSITCVDADGAERSGSGVFISEEGHVLTAKHVVLGKSDELLDTTICRGGIGNSKLTKNELQPLYESENLDAAVLQYPGRSNGTYMKYCPLDTRFSLAEVVAIGFPGETRTGQPSMRVGVLSTITPDRYGLIESDSATTLGMSGGMVTLVENDMLIGIVAGTQLNIKSIPSFYAVLAAEQLAREFSVYGLEDGGSDCDAVNALSEEFGSGQNQWTAADDPLPLGYNAESSFCYIVKVWGKMDHQSDIVAIDVDQDGQFILTGKNGGGGLHGASARCVRLQ